MATVPLTKPDVVRGRIEAEIRAGELARGQRLPGEHALASRFEVSRTTVRQALAELQRAGYITTQAGSGSFITYDGRDIAPTQSWSASFAALGLSSSAHVLRVEVVEEPELAAELKIDSAAFLAVDRVRVVHDKPVSLERSRVPFWPELADVPEAGLEGGSLTATLEQRGLFLDVIEEWATVGLLGPTEAGPLGRQVGEPWISLVSHGHCADGRLVEHITSWLDPAHFHLRHVTLRSGSAEPFPR